MLDNTYAEVELCAVEEALRRTVRQVVVSEDAELLMSPSNPELANCFVQVHLKSYKDLQLLGFVPRKLSEEKVRQAIADDNDEVYKLASSMASQLLPYDYCECQNQSARTSMSSRGSLRSIYARSRKDHNPALGRLLSDHFGAYVPWDAPLASITRNWLAILDNRLYDINKALPIALVEDITINRNASLTVDPNLKSLLARNVWIHRSGRLLLKGSYIKIWANSIQSFLGIESIRLVEETPLWLVGLEPK